VGGRLAETSEVVVCIILGSMCSEIGNNILRTTIYCYCVWCCVLCIDSDMYVCMSVTSDEDDIIAHLEDYVYKIRHENWQVG
jgi:hypothetical protein